MFIVVVNYFVVILVAGNHFMNLSTVLFQAANWLAWMDGNNCRRVVGGLYVASSWKFNIVINSFFRHSTAQNNPCGLHTTIVANIVTELHRNHFQGLI